VTKIQGPEDNFIGLSCAEVKNLCLCRHYPMHLNEVLLRHYIVIALNTVIDHLVT